RRGCAESPPPARRPVPPLPYNDAEDWTPDDPSRGRRIDWAALLKRSWLIDVLVCPRCAAPMRVISHIEDERLHGRGNRRGPAGSSLRCHVDLRRVHCRHSPARRKLAPTIAPASKSRGRLIWRVNSGFAILADAACVE